MASGLIFNIQRYSINDGPGIRTTVFFKGCPLNCAWCHNPEGISPKPQLAFIETRCAGCGKCAEVCPEALSPAQFTEFGMQAFFKCKLCGKCVEICLAQAREIVGKLFSVSELINEILKDRVFYEESKGGVTFSGGEPLLQYDFLIEMLAVCRKYEISTAIDTCGFTTPERLKTVAELADLFLFDIKFYNNRKHIYYTGVSNEGIFNNLKILALMNKKVWLRVPILPGLNTSDEELCSIAEMVAHNPAIKQINLLPYHRTGLQKAKRIYHKEEQLDLRPPQNDELEKIKRLFLKTGKPVIIGG